MNEMDEIEERQSLYDIIVNAEDDRNFKEILENSNFSQDDLNNGLISAIIKGKSYLVTDLINEGADVNYREVSLYCG